MRAGIIFGGESLKRIRAHELEAQVHDALVRSEQRRVDMRESVSESFDLGLEKIAWNGLEREADLGSIFSTDRVPG